jgi:hypothetical protein
MQSKEWRLQSPAFPLHPVFEDLLGRWAPFFDIDAITHRLFARQPTCRQVLVVAGTSQKTLKFHFEPRLCFVIVGLCARPNFTRDSNRSHNLTD